MKSPNSVIFGAISAIGLAACGSDGSFTPGQPSTPASAVINNGNAGTVTKAAYYGAFESVQFAQVNGAFGIASNASNGVSKDNSWQAASKLSQGVLAGSAISNVPVGPTTEMCFVSGSVTIWGDIADPSTLTTGDVLNIDSDNCDDGNGEVLNGLLQLTITGVSGDVFSSLYMLAMNLKATDFSVTIGGSTETANGTIGSTVDTFGYPYVEGSVFGDSFTVVSPSSTETLLNFSSIFTDDLEPQVPVWTNDAMGTVVSSQFTGAIEYDTPTIFSGEWFSYPSTGQLLVTGANNATARLIALDEVNVRIDADYDGNGTVDESFFMTWDELLDNQT